MRSKVYSLAIIGAGPAGLAAGIAFERSGLDFCIFDTGKKLDARSHENAADLGHGTGGAGLYSDGKFSFFPSATELWSLQPRDDLETSYDWLISELRNIGLPMVGVPLAVPVSQLGPRLAQASVEKKYLSTYGAFEQRKAFISSLERALYERIYSNATVTEITEHERGYRLRLSSHSMDEGDQYIGKAVLLANGRFGPLLVHRTESIQSCFRRLEIGIRIEQPADKFFLATHPQVDPKFIFTDAENNTQYRTFCCCRNGEIVIIKHEGIVALSGRADGGETGLSNVGFHMRILDEAVAGGLLEGLLDRLSNSAVPTQMTLVDFLNADVPENTPIGHLLGPVLAPLMLGGLRSLTAHFGDAAFSDATIHYPAVEGFGQYPVSDNSLRIPGTRIWAAGDVNGRFRGLVPALVSGYFSGLQIARKMRSEA